MSITARLAAVALFVALIGLVTPTVAHAAEVTETNNKKSAGQTASLAKFVTFAPKEEEPETKKVKKPKVIKHVVVEGETLTTIAKEYDTTWRRLYNKNQSIANPDVLSVGDQLVVPNQKEKLKNRKLPVVEEEVEVTQAAVQPVAAPVEAPQPAPSASFVAPANTSGNTYFTGYCTWYAKSRRPDLPNNLGNADTWTARASAQGYATGATPRVGAIGQQGMHVVYIESVNGDGTVTVSEMNYAGWNVVSSRTVSASSFSYIY